MSHIQTKLKLIKLVILDVDGVLTDGSISYGSDNLEIKTFNAKDGFGITLGRKAGIQFGIITGRTSDIVSKRVKELKIKYYHPGKFYKRDAIKQIIKQSEFSLEQVAYVGDEIIDLVCQDSVAIFACPVDSASRVLKNADLVLKNKGGHGAVREFIELILDAKNILQQTENEFINATQNLIETSQ